MKKVKVEFKMRNVEMDGVPLTGTIDRLDIMDKDTTRIVDYKTGSTNEDKIRRPGKSTPHGGAYWRQLVFYKILFEHYNNFTQRVMSGTISYLEPDSRGAFLTKTITYSPKDVAQVREMIKDTYTKIRAHDFYEGCGKPSCKWCQFVRENITPTSFSNPEIEALDDEHKSIYSSSRSIKTNVGQQA